MTDRTNIEPFLQEQIDKLRAERDEAVRLLEQVSHTIDMSDTEHEDFADSGADVVEDLWIYADQVRAFLKGTTPLGKPRVFTVIEGGVLQSVYSDVPCDLVTIDYDTEGCTGPDVVELEQDDGRYAEAIVTIDTTTVDPAEVGRTFAAATRALEHGA